MFKPPRKRPTRIRGGVTHGKQANGKHKQSHPQAALRPTGCAQNTSIGVTATIRESATTASRTDETQEIPESNFIVLREPGTVDYEQRKGVTQCHPHSKV
mgnify:CR=1 FL=1